MKLRFILPVVQAALAGALMWWDYRMWGDPGLSGRCDSPGTTPAFPLLLAINLPALPVALLIDSARFFGFKYNWLAYFSSRAFFLAAIGLSWHWLALNVETGRLRKMIWMFSWRPGRFVLDALLIAAGLLCGLAAIGRLREIVQYWPPNLGVMGCFAPVWVYELSSGIFAAVLVAWAFVLVVFYGRDFVLCYLEKASAT